MKRFIAAIALTAVLSISALAGEIPTVGVIPPPPPPDGVQAMTNTVAPGEIPSGGFTEELSEAAFGFVQLLVGAVV